MNELRQLERVLGKRIREEEARYESKTRKTDTLWGHLVRVAGFAEQLGTAEGLDPVACRLAGLFHDAGKFVSGCYHAQGQIEEEQSVQIFREMAADSQLGDTLIEEVSEAILQVYRDAPKTSELGKVLFDADNLDKLGPLGVANYFVKAGLRGRGVSLEMLYQLTVEMTYARYAEQSMATPTGKALASKRAKQTVGFINGLLDALREDGVFDVRVFTESFDGLILDVVAPRACTCGAELERRIWADQGVKCNQIHLEHRCMSCGQSHEFHFCRPRLIA